MAYNKLLGMVLIFVMSLTIIGGQHRVSASSSFVDVATTHEAFEEIHYLYNLGIVRGVTTSGPAYYKPNDAVTRGQAAKMVVLAAGYQPLKVTQSSFKDVKVDTEFSGYIERAAQLGLFTKSTDGMFYPNTPIVRDEMSRVLAKAFKMDTSKYAGTTLPFSDITTQHPYHAYVAAIYYNGVTNGSGDKFYPTMSVTRGHFALFVARAKSDKYRLDKPVQSVSVPNLKDAIGMVEVTTNNLNVRSSADSSVATNLVGQVNKGDKLAVFADEGSWLKVAYNSKFAYVFKKYTAYIDESSPEPTPTPIPTPEPIPPPTPEPSPAPNLTGVVGRVTTNNLNVRAGEGTNYDVLGSLKLGEKVTVLSVSKNWVKISYKEQTGYVSKLYIKLLNQKGSVVKNRIIVLDPGHGGKDPGAVSQSAAEKAIVYKVTSLVRQKLEAKGAKVIMTRTDDTYLTLEERVKIASTNYAELFVSIHVNAASSAAAQGTETYYSVSTGDSYLEDIDLATFINDKIVDGADMKDRGIKKYPYYVINNLKIPAVLVELGFITNEADRLKLVNDTYVEKYAQAITDGITQYYAKQ